MEVYESEQDQIEAIKKWWAKNGKAVIAGLLIGGSGLFAGIQWQNSSQASRAQASVEYQGLLMAMEVQDVQMAKDLGAKLLGEFADTSYATLAALMMAKVYVEEGDMDAAGAYLRTAMNQDDMPEMKQLARIRLARLQLAQGNADEAMATLGKPIVGFDSVYHELKGDIQLAQGSREDARASYQRALDEASDRVDTSFLQMKLDDLGGRVGADA